MLRVHRAGARPRGSPADADLRDDRSRHRDEPPAVRAAQVGRRRRYDRGKIMTPRSWKPARTSAATSTSTATASRTARCLARIRRAARISPAGTTRNAYAKLLRGRPGLRLQHGAPAAQVRDRQVAGAATGRAQRRAKNQRRFGALIYFGSTSPAMNEAHACAGGARHRTRRAARPRISVRRGVRNSSPRHEAVFVVEQNRDAPDAHAAGQRARSRPRAAVAVLHYDGTPITARFIVKAIAERMKPSKLRPLARGKAA